MTEGVQRFLFLTRSAVLSRDSIYASLGMVMEIRKTGSSSRRKPKLLRVIFTGAIQQLGWFGSGFTASMFVVAPYTGDGAYPTSDAELKDRTDHPPAESEATDRHNFLDPAVSYSIGTTTCSDSGRGTVK